MDHFYQLPGIGTLDQPMLEAYTALGALASATEHVQLVEEAMANPRLREHIPLMIGGSGEKKTIPLAARHQHLAEKVEVVKQRCEEIDRDPATLETSMLVGVLLDAGIDGVVIYLPTQVTGYQPGQITALGEALKPLVAADR